MCYPFEFCKPSLTASYCYTCIITLCKYLKIFNYKRYYLGTNSLYKNITSGLFCHEKIHSSIITILYITVHRQCQKRLLHQRRDQHQRSRHHFAVFFPFPKHLLHQDCLEVCPGALLGYSPYWTIWFQSHLMSSAAVHYSKALADLGNWSLMLSILMWD